GPPLPAELPPGGPPLPAPPRQEESGRGVGEQADAPAEQRPQEPELPRRSAQVNDDEQDVDGGVDRRVDVEPDLASRKRDSQDFHRMSWMLLWRPSHARPRCACGPLTARPAEDGCCTRRKRLKPCRRTSHTTGPARG